MSGVLHGIVAALKTAAAATDSFFKYVTLLLHGDGTNGAQNNTFLDGSTNAFTITRNGNTTQGSFSPFSQTGWGNYFDGTGDDLQLTNAAALSPGTGDFTFECWAYPQGSIASINFFTGFQSGLSVGTDASGNLIYGDAYVANVITTTTPLPVNTWSHIAVARSGTTNSLYLNGTRIGTATSSADLTTGTANYIGSNGNTAGRIYYTGYISNLRLVKGTAVYDPTLTTLTVPTSPLTAITNTSLLTCQSNRFIDNSSNAFAITRNGDVRVEAFNPFNPSTTYSTANVGGSGYFDGTGDSLVTPSNAALAMGSGNFTWEAWYYPTSAVAFATLIDSRPVGGFGGYYLGYGSPATTFVVYENNMSIISTSNVPKLFSWNHIAVSRSGTSLSLFINGVREGTATSSLNASNNTVNCGATGITGYISDLRLIKGTAVYDPTLTTLTVPTTPLTAITNTSLLLNYTNGGIFDNASQTVLETVGNAQVSTAQFKWGTGSMYFDGTGDWLTAIDRPALRFGTGPFTIECWLYLGATGAARGIVGKGTATTGWLLSTDASNKVVFTYGSSTITSTAALSGSTWYFLTVVREGTGTNQTKIYIDGTNDGTGTVSTDFNQTNILYVGADRTGGSAMNGYIDDLRITNGYARYTANFTPPTAAFPDN